jgi:hypothetical protein
MADNACDDHGVIDIEVNEKSGRTLVSVDTARLTVEGYTQGLRRDRDKRDDLHLS